MGALLPDLGSIGNVLETPSFGGGSATTGVSTPWQDNFDVNSFYKPITIEGERFDRVYPYRLLVLRRDRQSGSYSIFSNGSTTPQTTITTTDNDSKVSGLFGSWRMTFDFTDRRWVYTLPITPQQLSISTVFTTNNIPTMTGIIEEHNGIKYKIISAQGSFGVWPFRPNTNASLGQSSGLSSAVNTLFGGTISAVNQTLNQVRRTVNAATSSHPESATPAPSINDGEGQQAGTGYAQALLLDQFLEQYAELKKRFEGEDLRLALDIPKQNQTFLVSPIQFAYFQGADSPNEYKFNLQLKAWKRIVLNSNEQAGDIFPLSISPNTNVIRQALNAITEARRTLASVYNVIRAVNSDVTSVFNAIGEVATFLKLAQGLPVAIADLPLAISQNYKYQVSDAFARLSQQPTTPLVQSQSNQVKTNALKSFALKTEGLSALSVVDGQIGTQAASSFQTSGADLILSNPNQSPEIFDQITVEDLQLNQSNSQQINDYFDSVSLLTVDEIQQIINQIETLRFQLGNLFNAGNDQYNTTFNKPPKFNRGYATTIDEFLILQSLYNSIQSLYALTATDQLDRDNQISAVDFVQSLAIRNGVPFNNQISMIRAPVPFGLTIEQISGRYLGDPDRYNEIVTLNALKSPYIDETGFEYDFLSSAIGRQFNIDSNENLYIGQRITILATGLPRQVRTILDIEQIAANNYLITVDGAADLDAYGLSNQAYIKAYLAGTVNSQNVIFIPSNLPSPPDLAIRPIPAAEADPLSKVSGVDLLLDDAYDIVIDPQGDFRLAFGLQNLIQTLKIKLITQKGSLIKHPTFGAGVQVGTSNADVSATEIANQIRSTVLADPRFQDLSKLQVDIRGNTIFIAMSVTLAGNQGVFPISFLLN